VAFGAVNLASSDAVTGDLPFSNLAQGSALSVLGVTGNATADNASIAAGTDHQVLRRSGTSLAFGAISLAQSAAITGVLPAANGGTGVDNSTRTITINGNAGTFNFTAASKTLGISNSITLAGTDATTMTFPSTSQTVAGLGLAQTFTAAQTFRAANAIRSEAASTQDAIVIAGRAGGTSSYAITLTPATLAASRTLTLPEPGSNETLGYINTPIISQSAAYTLVLTDAGKTILHPDSDDNARTFTIPANGSVAYPVGTVVTFVNMKNTLTIAITTDTMYLAGPGTTGSRTLAEYGVEIGREHV
jgi:hypothetical protein